MPAASTARADMIAATVRLLQERGPSASGLSEIIAAAGAPRGSIYHHFPDGKDQLLAAALAHFANPVAALIETAAGGAASPGEAVRRIARLFRAGPDKTHWTTGCPIAATAAEGDHQSPEVREAVKAAFALWAHAASTALEVQGVAPEKAEKLGLAVLAALEGAVIVSRGLRSAHAFDATVELLAAAADAG